MVLCQKCAADSNWTVKTVSCVLCFKHFTIRGMRKPTFFINQFLVMLGFQRQYWSTSSTDACLSSPSPPSSSRPPHPLHSHSPPLHSHFPFLGLVSSFQQSLGLCEVEKPFHNLVSVYGNHLPWWKGSLSLSKYFWSASIANCFVSFLQSNARFPVQKHRRNVSDTSALLMSNIQPAEAFR